MPSSAASASLPGPQDFVLIDATALIALLADEPAADAVEEILRSSAAITAVNLAEATDRLGRRHGLTAERVRPVVEGLLQDGLDLLPIGPNEAWRAAQVRTTHYHRTRCPLSLADAVLIASAHQDETRSIASSDSHLLRVAREEGISVIPLPDSKGRMPE